MKKQSVSPASYKEYAKVFRIWIDLYNKYRAVLDGDGPDEAPFLEGAIVPGKGNFGSEEDIHREIESLETQNAFYEKVINDSHFRKIYQESGIERGEMGLILIGFEIVVTPKRKATEKKGPQKKYWIENNTVLFQDRQDEFGDWSLKKELFKF